MVHQKKQKARCGPDFEGEQGYGKDQAEKSAVNGKGEDSDAKGPCGKACCKEKHGGKEGEEGQGSGKGQKHIGRREEG